MRCPNCTTSFTGRSCPSCQWEPKAKPAQVHEQAQYAYLLSPDEQAYGQFRTALFNRGRRSGQILTVTADGLEAWLHDPEHEAWASRQPMRGCSHRPEPHSLLSCLLDEIQAAQTVPRRGA